MEAIPTAAIWRRSVEDKKTSTVPDELWYSPRGLVRVNQGPHEDLKLVGVKIRGHFVDAIINKNIRLKSVVPYNRFPFGTAPT